FHFVFGHAVAHKPAEAVIAFIDGDSVTGAGELLCGGKASGSGADDRHAHAGIQTWFNRCGPAFFKGAFHNGKFHVFNCHGVIVDAQYAGAFARGGAQAAGKFGEIVCRVQAVVGFAPAVLAYQVIPLGDDIAQGAALVTEGDSAVHAAGGLLFNLASGGLFVDLAVIHQAQWDWAVRRGCAVKLLKSVWISHYFTASMIALLISRPSRSAVAMMVKTARYGVGTTFI